METFMMSVNDRRQLVMPKHHQKDELIVFNPFGQSQNSFNEQEKKLVSFSLKSSDKNL